MRSFVRSFEMAPPAFTNTSRSLHHHLDEAGSPSLSTSPTDQSSLVCCFLRKVWTVWKWNTIPSCHHPWFPTSCFHPTRFPFRASPPHSCHLPSHPSILSLPSSPPQPTILLLPSPVPYPCLYLPRDPLPHRRQAPLHPSSLLLLPHPPPPRPHHQRPPPHPRLLPGPARSSLLPATVAARGNESATTRSPANGAPGQASPAPTTCPGKDAATNPNRVPNHSTPTKPTLLHSESESPHTGTRTTRCPPQPPLPR